MTNFFQLFLSASGRAPVAIVDRLTQAASALFSRQHRRGRQRESQAPPILIGSNHLRRDIGLPPVDSYGRPI